MFTYIHNGYRVFMITYKKEWCQKDS
jgi:hypothetical protein